MKVVRHILVAVILTAAATWCVGYFAFSSPPHAYAAFTEAERREAAAYLRAGIEPTPEAAVFGKWRAADGAMLETLTLDVGAAADSKGLAVIAPGFTAPVEIFAPTMIALGEAGYDVAVLSTRGQGRSARMLDNPEKAYVEDYATLVDDLAGYIAEMRGDRPVFVMAISQGGHIALRMAGDIAPDVKAYSLIVPMVKIETGGFPYLIARGMSAFFSATGLGEQYSPGRHDYAFEDEALHEADACNANPDEAKVQDAMFILDERLRIGGVTHQWVTATTASTAHITGDAYPDRIREPVLMFTAGDDRIVNTEASQRLCEALSSCEEVHYPASRHCITRETEAVQTEIYARTIAFFDRHGAL